MPSETLANPLFLNQSTFSSSSFWFLNSSHSLRTLRTSSPCMAQHNPNTDQASFRTTECWTTDLEITVAAIRTGLFFKSVSERIEACIKEVLHCFVHQITSISWYESKHMKRTFSLLPKIQTTLGLLLHIWGYLRQTIVMKSYLL